MKKFEDCTCICHRMQGVRHDQPCCDQTYKQRDKEPSFTHIIAGTEGVEMFSKCLAEEASAFTTKDPDKTEEE